MGKKLVTKNNMDDFICKEENKIYVDHTMILTPGVHDTIRNNGIIMVYGDKKDTAAESPAPFKEQNVEEQGDCREELIRKIAAILKKDFHITSSQEMAEIIHAVCEKINK